MLHDARDLVATQDDGYANRHAGPRHVGDSANLDVQYVAIKEQECAERLVLRGRTDATLRRQPRKESGDLGRAHVRRLPLPMKTMYVRIQSTYALSVRRL
jgi:hypothetical protein